MATTNIHTDIRAGIANAKANPADFGVNTFTKKPHPHRTLSTHPNRNLRLPTMKTFTVERQTMDPSKGDNGFIRLTVQATTAAEAAAMADQSVAAINEPFITHDRGPRLS